MNILATKRPYTPEDLLTMPDGDLYELVDGQLLEKNMGAKASWMGSRINGSLDTHNTEHAAGWVFNSEGGYQCFPDAPNKVRKPDVSFVRKGRLPGEQVPDGHIRLAPDLAVEVVSPNDLYYEVERKVDEYLRAGVRLVWVVNPQLGRVRVHRLDGTVTDLRADDELSGEGVLPGFRCSLRELFRPPVGTEPAE